MPGPSPLTRRTLLAALAAAPIAARARDAAIELEWRDLVPAGGGVTMETLRGIGIVQHDEMSSTPAEQPAATGVTTQYDGRTVRLPGYVVPLDFSGTGVTAFILVPYVGACIHVPPPPANQLVLVTTERPYENTDLFEPVAVTGTFGTSATKTELAEIGYTLSADRIEPYEP